MITLNVFNAFNPSDPAEVTKDSLIISPESRFVQHTIWPSLSLCYSLLSWQFSRRRPRAHSKFNANRLTTSTHVLFGFFFPPVARCSRTHALNNVRTRERVKLICISRAAAAVAFRTNAFKLDATTRRSSHFSFQNACKKTRLVHTESKLKYSPLTCFWRKWIELQIKIITYCPFLWFKRCCIDCNLFNLKMRGQKIAFS